MSSFMLCCDAPSAPCLGNLPPHPACGVVAYEKIDTFVVGLWFTIQEKK